MQYNNRPRPVVYNRKDPAGQQTVQGNNKPQQRGKPNKFNKPYQHRPKKSDPESQRLSPGKVQARIEDDYWHSMVGQHIFFQIGQFFGRGVLEWVSQYCVGIRPSELASNNGMPYGDGIIGRCAMWHKAHLLILYPLTESVSSKIDDLCVQYRRAMEDSNMQSLANFKTVEEKKAELAAAAAAASATADGTQL